ncbi:MAG: hypothetical protein H6742_12120 [Alphaproteobacteria bacterium]|nr:hypothetical protein [Alphaproteobacteria bacterium]
MTDRNPFPGPQPYSAGDRGRFFGRDATALDLVDEVLSHRVLTVFGPSGAGKSSLLQAAVLPTLTDDEGVRCVTVDSWPPGIVARSGPVSRLTEALSRTLDLGPVREDDLAAAVELAFLVSDRPLLILLDQIEQLLVPHEPEVLESLVLRLAELEAWRGGSLHVLITLREDYLGRWAALLARRPRLIRHSFRVKRLTAPEITEAVIRTAAAADPPQAWRPVDLAPYIAEMELPGEWRADGAEVETAYVQIVCRQLFGAGGPDRVGSGAAAILEHYLGDTLADLGDLQEPARNLLATRFVHGESGRRIQVSREEVQAEVGSPDATERILGTLEQARILRARQHQGQQLFELGHDWLAKPVREEVARQRALQEQRERRRRRLLVGLAIAGTAALALAFGALFVRAQLALAEAERQTALAQAAEEDAARERDRAVSEREAADAARREADSARQNAETAQQLTLEAKALEAEAKQEALDALGVADEARVAAEAARVAAEESERLQAQRAREARDGQRMLAVRELLDQPHRAAPFLVDIAPESGVSGWRGAAWHLLQHPLAQPLGDVGAPAAPVHLVAIGDGLRVALDGGGLAPVGGGDPWPSGPVEALAADGPTVAAVVVGADGVRRLELRARDGGGVTARVDLGTQAITAAAWLPGEGGLVLVGMDGTIHQVARDGRPLATAHHDAALSAVAPHPAGGRFATTATDGSVQLRDAQGRVVAKTKLPRSALAVAWLGDTLVAAGADGALHRWTPGGALASSPVLHDRYVVQLLARPGHPDQLLSRDQGGAVQLVRFDASGSRSTQPPGLATGIDAAAWSADGRWLATVGRQGRADLWEIDDAGLPLRRFPLLAHGLSTRVRAAAFSPGARTLTTLDDGGRAIRWPGRADGVAALVRSPGGTTVDALAFSPDGAALWAQTDAGWDRLWGTAGERGAPAATTTAASTDGRTQATLQGDGIVRVLVDEVDELLLTEAPAPGRVVAVAPAGDRVAVAATDGSVRLWTLSSDPALFEALEALPVGCPTVRDRVRFFGERPDEATLLVQACRDGGP